MVLVDHDIANIRAAAKWPLWKSTPNVHMSQEDLAFRVVPVEGMGMGMIATRAIAAGELIYQERPFYAAGKILKVPSDILHSGDFHSSALCRLGSAQQLAFVSLSNCFDNKKAFVHGILSTNTLQGDLGSRLASDPPEVSVCFPTLSRANHSCTPTANYFFQFSDFTGRFYATRDIQRGEAITVMYRELANTQKTRKSELFERYRFTCTCPACSTPPTSSMTKESDARRLHVKRVLKSLSNSLSGLVTVEEIEKAAQYADQEKLVAHKLQIIYLGSARVMSIALTQTGMAYTLKSQRMLKEARELATMIEGPDSYTVEGITLGLNTMSMLAGLARM